MARIGDKVTIMVHGPVKLSGTATVTGSSDFGASTTITTKGKIIGEAGGNWLVELDESLLGNKQFTLPKDRVT